MTQINPTKPDLPEWAGWTGTSPSVGAGAAAEASSEASSLVSSSPLRYFSNSSFSTSGFNLLFLIRIFRFSLLGGGNGFPFCNYLEKKGENGL